MYSIEYTRQFKRSLKLCKKRGLPLEELHKVISSLEVHGRLPMEYKPHKLTGNYAGVWECHVKPDWLLLWQQNDKELVLLFLNTGTHSDLF